MQRAGQEERPIIKVMTIKLWCKEKCQENKKEFINAITTEAETAAGQCSMKGYLK